MADVDDDAVTALVDALTSQGLGAVARRAALGRLRSVFAWEVQRGRLARNPFDGRKVRTREARGRNVQHWPTTGKGTAARCEHRDAFRRVADADPLAAAWRLSLCGLTRADVMGLRWSDVDLDAGTVTVAQGRVVVDGGSVVDDPKSSQRERTLPVDVADPGTVALLRSLRVSQAADRLRAGTGWTDSGLVVVDALGVGLRPEVYSDRFRRLCATAGVPVIRLHSLRHTLALLLHARGVAPADAAAWLGHTLEVHLSVYMPDAKGAGIAAAAAALGLAV